MWGFFGLFVFILLDVGYSSWTYKLVSFVSFGKFWSVISLNIVFCPFFLLLFFFPAMIQVLDQLTLFNRPKCSIVFIIFSLWLSIWMLSIYLFSKFFSSVIVQLTVKPIKFFTSDTVFLAFPFFNILHHFSEVAHIFIYGFYLFLKKSPLAFLL